MMDGRSEGRKNAVLGLDYPRPNEPITGEEYSFRVRTRAAGAPEISIDDGPWKPCRPAVGYWWFDWRRGTLGAHKAVVRLPTEGGALVSRPRRFRVELPGTERTTALPARKRRRAVVL